ncbi:MAG: class I SAM-dependent methyltransferase [Clostridia bacterium]|nr:class I SAM-dependent methyltransferase [Clostridia bacterium]
MYEGLSCFYDAMTEDIDYRRLSRFVDRTVSRSKAYKAYKKRGETPILLDAACGTGSTISYLVQSGYDCIGLDISDEMLDQAKCNVPDSRVLWICQDMCKMDLFGSVTGICCLTDSVNHVLSERALQGFLNRAHNFLDPGGVLLFDVLTEAHFTRQGTQMHCFADYETISCFWTGTYDPAKRRCTYDISCFIQEEDGRYTRTDDRVVERVWLPEELGKMLENAGFAKVRVLSGQDVPVGRTGQNRLYYICEKD